MEEAMLRTIRNWLFALATLFVLTACSTNADGTLTLNGTTYNCTGKGSNNTTTPRGDVICVSPDGAVLKTEATSNTNMLDTNIPTAIPTPDTNSAQPTQADGCLTRTDIDALVGSGDWFLEEQQLHKINANVGRGWQASHSSIINMDYYGKKLPPMTILKQGGALTIWTGPEICADVFGAIQTDLDATGATETVVDFETQAKAMPFVAGIRSSGPEANKVTADFKAGTYTLPNNVDIDMNGVKHTHGTSVTFQAGDYGTVWFVGP